MSVSLRMRRRDGQESELDAYVPVAAQRTFYEVWVPGARALGLKWVQWFGDSGVVVEQEDIAPVLDELDRLKAWVQRQHPDELGEGVVSRIERVMETLRAYEGHPELKLSIG